MKLGHRLCSDPCVDELIGIVNESINLKYDIAPFVFLNGSSGCGKTQMAFNLMAAGKKVKYFLSVKVSDQQQPIYQCFSEISDLFVSCIENDLKVLEQEINYSVKSFSMILYPKPLSIYGFILGLLNQNTDNDVMYFHGPAMRAEVEQKLKTIDEIPIIFIDEFPLISTGRNNTDSNEDKLRLMRNVFRSLRLPVILSSTNSSAINLIKVQYASRTSDGISHPILWCNVFSKFPKFQIEDENFYDDDDDDDDETMKSYVVNLLQSSRPLFSSLLTSNLSLNEVKNQIKKEGNLIRLMDEKMADLAKALKDLKNAEKDIEGFFLHGQVCLFFSASYITPQAEDKNTMSIHRHFANLCGPKVFDLFLRSGNLVYKSHKNTFEIWKPTVAFPDLDSDLLLYLSLMGGPNNNAIEDKGKRIPFLSAFKTVKSLGTLQMDFSNSIQLSNDGMEMECLVASAVVLASHSNGFSGISFGEFFPALLYELDIGSGKERMELPEEFMNIQIPFLSPPNQKWPGFLSKTFGLNVSNFMRMKNSDRIDFSIEDGSVTGECKDYRGPLSLKTIEAIMKRIPEKSKIHLIITNKLQNSYYSLSDRSFDDFINEDCEILKKCEIYKLSEKPLSGTNLILERINGLELKKAKKLKLSLEKLVIFVPLLENYK
jgi:hypothetical protein